MAEDSFSMDADDEDLLNVSYISGLWGESDLSVSAVDAVDLDDSVVSAVSQRSTLAQSTTVKSKGRREFKSPPAPAPTKYFGQCAWQGCRKHFKTANGFNKHMLDHRLKDLASITGGFEEIISHLRDDVSEVIMSIASTSNCSDLLNATQSAEWEDFFTDILGIIRKGLAGGDSKVRTVMPGALRSNLQKGINSSLSDAALRNQLYHKFQLVANSDYNIFSLFLFDFLWGLVEKTVLFVCRNMLKNLPGKGNAVAPVRGDAGHVLTHQILHHVVGYALHHLVSHANRFQKNAKLQRMRECIFSKFVKSGVHSVISSDDKAFWTHSLNRKSLVFVSDQAFPFFIQLGNLFLVAEKKDGSLLLEEVLVMVFKESSLIAMWDEIVEGNLDEHESIDLLTKIVKIIARTYGRGNMLKKMNILSNSNKANKKTLSISHRASLL